jgi:hypothetical protein
MKKKIVIIIVAIFILTIVCFLANYFFLKVKYNLLNQYDKEVLVSEYLKENISVLSPTKEVLGGKFYITKILFIDDNSGEVEYEDGHILLKSSFDYYIDKNGKMNVSNFIIKIN